MENDSAEVSLGSRLCENVHALRMRRIESGSELSYCDATGKDTMTKTVPIDHSLAARATVSRPRSKKAATVSASALALHLDCSRDGLA